MIGDFLYALTARDTQLTPIQIVHQSNQRIGNQAVHTTDLNIPAAYAFYFSEFQVQGVAGAAQTADYALVSVVDPLSGSIISTILKLARTSTQNEDATTTNIAISRRPRIWVHPGYRLEFSVSFSGAVNPNTTDVSVQGILVPRGNFSIGQLSTP